MEEYSYFSPNYQAPEELMNGVINTIHIINEDGDSILSVPNGNRMAINRTGDLGKLLIFKNESAGPGENEVVLVYDLP